MNNQIARFNEIIERIESRCMATDGPVTPTLHEMRESELAEIWRLLTSIRDTAAELTTLRARLETVEAALTKIAERVETAVGAGVIELGPDLYGTRSGRIQHVVFSVIETARRALSQEGSEPS